VKGLVEKAGVLEVRNIFGSHGQSSIENSVDTTKKVGARDTMCSQHRGQIEEARVGRTS